MPENLVTFLKHHKAIILVLILAAAFRLYQLTTVPYGFFCDEANVGYSAYSLITKGTDEYGAKWPLFFYGFGDGRLPLSIYLNIPFISILGLSIFSNRFAAVFYSLVAVYLAYLIGSKWVDKKLGVMSALMLAVSPWAIHQSRLGWEISYVLPFLLTSIYFLTKAVKKPVYLIAGFIVLALAQYTYYSGVVVSPVLFVASVIYFFFTTKNKRFLTVGILCYLVFTAPLVIGAYQGKILHRMTLIASANNTISESLSLKIKNSALAYIHHFDPNFLFFHTREYEFITRHTVAGVGQVPRYGLVLLPLGLWLLVKNRKSTYGGFAALIVLSILAAYPLTGLANDNQVPVATRAYPGVLTYTFLLAYGMYWIFELSRKAKPGIKIGVRGLMILAIIFEMGYFSVKYFRDYPRYSSDFWGWQAGPEEVMTYFKTVRNNYDNLYLTGNFNAPQIFIPFFDPTGECRGCGIGSYNDYDATKKQIFALRRDDIENAKKDRPDLKFYITRTVNLPNGTPELYIGQFKPW